MTASEMTLLQLHISQETHSKKAIRIQQWAKKDTGGIFFEVISATSRVQSENGARNAPGGYQGHPDGHRVLWWICNMGANLQGNKRKFQSLPLSQRVSYCHDGSLMPLKFRGKVWEGRRGGGRLGLNRLTTAPRTGDSAVQT